MCGIAGFFSFDQDRSTAENRRIAQAMATSMQTRGPDDEGVWNDPDAPLLLAHRRLSIIDLSPLGHQPMLSANERYALSYNGEIYNFQVLRRALENMGQRFRGTSDTEVLLAAISTWGLEQTLEKIEGMFALALWDRKTRMLHLVRDRFGEKPLYFGWAGKDFAFASETRAFDCLPGFEGRIRPDAIGLLIRFGCIPAPYAVFEGLWKLPPGCKLRVDFSAMTPGADLNPFVTRYWSAEEDFNARLQAPRLSETQYIETLDKLLLEAVKTRMVSDAPLGAFLSGGIDSSLVVAMMQAQSAAKVKTYTVGFEEKSYDEAPFAKAVAQHLRTDHTELYVSQPEIQAIIPDMARIYDEPYANPSQLPTAILNRFAGKHVRVALSGDGGDELFGGYHQHDLLPRVWPALSLLPWPLRASIGKTLGMVPKNALTGLHREYGYRLYKRFQSLEKVMSGRNLMEAHGNMLSIHAQPQNFVRELQALPLSAWDMKTRDPRGGVLQKSLLSDLLFYLPNDVLTKMDRAAMAFSLEVRAPFLDRGLLAFAGSLPDSLRVQGHNGKIILRRLLARYLPPELYERRKAGFNVPIDRWLMGPLREWGHDLLQGAGSENDPVLNRQNILQTWQGLQNGHKDSARTLWAVLMFEQWRRARKSGQ